MAMALLRRDSKLQMQRKMWEKSPASRHGDRVQEAAGARPGQAGQAPRLYYAGSSRAQLTAVENREWKTKRRSSTTPLSLRRVLPNAAHPSRTKMLQRGREPRMTPCSFTTPLPLHWVLPSAARADASQTFGGRQAPPQGRSGPMGAHGHAELLEQEGVKRAGLLTGTGCRSPCHMFDDDRRTGVPGACSFGHHRNEGDPLSCTGERSLLVVLLVPGIRGSSRPHLLARQGQGLLPLRRRNGEIKCSGRP